MSHGPTERPLSSPDRPVANASVKNIVSICTSTDWTFEWRGQTWPRKRLPHTVVLRRKAPLAGPVIFVAVI